MHKTEFLNLGFCSIFFKFWHNVSFVKDYSVLVGRHTIFQYFLVKGSLRPFRLHSSEKDAEYQNNHYKVESERTRFCVLTIQDWKYDMQKMF